MRSDNVKAGMQQAPHRSLFNALGFTEEEIKEMIQKRDELQEKSGYYKIYPQTIAIDVTNCKSAEESAHLVLENMKETIANGV